MHMLLTHNGSPVCAQECNFTCAIIFISNWKKKTQMCMSKHFKDPQNTLDPRGLRTILFFLHLVFVIWIHLMIFNLMSQVSSYKSV